MIYPEKPWFNWYKWNCEHWGTKWNTCDCYSQITEDAVTFVFSTAWSPAIPIFEELITKYRHETEILWADECYGSNCGTMTHEKGSRMFITKYEEDLDDPAAFAEELWENY